MVNFLLLSIWKHSMFNSISKANGFCTTKFMASRATNNIPYYMCHFINRWGFSEWAPCCCLTNEKSWSEVLGLAGPFLSLALLFPDAFIALSGFTCLPSWLQLHIEQCWSVFSILWLHCLFSLFSLCYLSSFLIKIPFPLRRQPHKQGCNNHEG